MVSSIRTPTPSTMPMMEVMSSGVISRMAAAKVAARSHQDIWRLKKPDTVMARKKVAASTCAPPQMISTTGPCSRMAGLYTKTKGTRKPTRANSMPRRPVFMASASAMPAAV